MPAIPAPVILDGFSVKIDDVELACASSHIELVPDVSTIEIKTGCGVVDYPGTVKWALKLTLYQSFDAGSVEETLSAAVDGGVPVTFSVMAYRDLPISATNPEWSGMVVPQPYTPISGDAGDASEIDLEWSTTGTPVKSVTPGAAVLAAEPEPANA
jgi:hypothetical protein